ncbi:MAG: AmmeMemoRadiSam system protein A [Gammaproteobacteria bacterium]|nr:MAG: AmmeMemoRadiSam system protein A [Gammaproteobacteria bacterium]
MTLSPKDQETLLQVARTAIQYGLEKGAPPKVEVSSFSPSLQAVRATFVTLEIAQRLRGCIGSLEASQAMVVDTAQHAYAAAFSDPRFPRLQKNEFPGLEMHISVLSPTSPLPFEGVDDLLRQLQPGIDGLIIAENGRRGTFLPTVWKSLPDPGAFLLQLKRKAGIPDDSSSFQAWRYTTESVPAAS